MHERLKPIGNYGLAISPDKAGQVFSPELEFNLPQALQEVRDLGDKAIILVCSGGAALALFHIGVIGAFAEAGIPWHAVIGTSAGAIGGLVAANMTCLGDWLKAKQFGETVGWKQLRTRALRLKPLGVYSFDPLAQYMDARLAEFQAPGQGVPLVAVAADVTDPRQKELALLWQPPEGKSWGDLVQASAAMPRLVVAPEFADRRWQDGGVIPREGFEPVGAARWLFSDAFIASIRLLIDGRNGLPFEEPDFRLRPCDASGRNGLRQSWQFDFLDVYRGYQYGAAVVSEILALMAKRGIKQSWLPGFIGPGHLERYFVDQRLAELSRNLAC